MIAKKPPQRTPIELRQFIRHRLRWLRRYGLRLLLFFVFILALVPESIFPLHRRWQAIAVQVSQHQFDYVGWELNALSAKVHQTLYGQHPFMDEDSRIQFVRDYIADLATAHSLEAQIQQLYSNPDIDDPVAESTNLRAERDTLRENLSQRQSTAEAILEGQVAAVLVEEGFGTAGQLFPPMAMRFTPVPNLLLTSPRDDIKIDVSLNLYALPIDEIVAIEQRIEQQHDVSALVVPLGGIALYPAMITETTSIQRAVEVFAHEWLHHYLYFFPLGIFYITGGEGFAGEARIINETTADIFGKDIALRVLERYYPDLVPPPQPESPRTETATPQNTPEAPVFDFGLEMNETRVTVDELLATGEIDDAETYMEERREFFFENGYSIRRINQAFFAFYGGYQGGAVPGIGGEDPIGPAIRNIHENSPSLHDFVLTMRSITTRDQLIQTANTLSNYSE